jgi:hypothetical protein
MNTYPHTDGASQGPHQQGFFLTYIWPVIYWALYWGLLYIAAALFVFVFHQKQAQQTEQAQQIAPVYKPRPLGADNLQPAANSGLEDGKRILTLRQTAHDSMCHVFTAQLPTKMQPFLDMDYYITISQPRGAELGSKSGLVATRAILESLAMDWPEGARPTTLEETITGIQTYTVIYTIYWQAAEGTAAGFYKFEHRLNLQTGDTLSVRLLQTGDVGS